MPPLLSQIATTCLWRHTLKMHSLSTSPLGSRVGTRGIFSFRAIDEKREAIYRVISNFCSLFF